MLALDFDGVVVDALHECAAVTYFAGTSVGLDQAPSLAPAMRAVSEQFLARFREVRPYCRTLADFMVANHVRHPIGSRERYEQARDEVGSEMLEHQATVGERLRARWRSQDIYLWLDSHKVHGPVVDALQRWSGKRWIVSAKDSESIREILEQHDVLHLVDSIVGSCGSKVAALQDASMHGDVLFIDDNLDHVLSATGTAGVTARWASWGYSAPDDDERARAAGIEPLQETELDYLTQLI